MLHILPGTAAHSDKIKTLYELVWPGERDPKEIDNHLALGHIVIADQEGHSQALYEQLGFSKLCLAGPWYHTGYATMLMGKVIE